MSENICISVSHSRGTSHYLINRFKKRYFALAAASVLVLAGSGSYSVYSLYEESQLSSKQLNVLNKQSRHLMASLSEESEANRALRLELEEKRAELALLTQRIDDVEAVLGVNGEDGEDMSLQARVDSAAVSSAVRATLFRLIPNGSPTPDTRMSSRYGSRVHPVTGKQKFHHGLDFSARIGTPIYAPADGIVEVVRSGNKGYGNFIRLNHSFGFTSSYSHMSKFNVKRGNYVNKGDLLGWTGNSGLSTGPHLHYEIRFLDRTLNPRLFVEWTPDNFESLFEKENKVQWASLLEMINNMVSMQVQLTQTPRYNPTLQTANNLAEQHSDGDQVQVSKL